MSPKENETTPTIDDDEIPEVAPQIVEDAPADVEAPRAPAAPRVRLVGVLPRLGLDRIGVGRIVAFLLFIAIALGGTHFLSDVIVVEVDDRPRVEMVERDALPTNLESSELLFLGQGAMQSGDIDQAARFLEEARIRAERDHPDDINLSVDVFEGLADVAELRGSPRVAELYREFIRQKQAELGSSLPLYSKAERSFRKGDLIAARSEFARFLLTRASLGPAGERYVKRARRRLAEIAERRYYERVGGPVSLSELTEPRGFFHERP